VAGAGIDELEKAIPGQIDDVVLEIARKILKSL
jgi:flagellar biosynthesis/type III secretory pathway protein FliH